MKHFFISLSVLVFLTNCNGEKPKETTHTQEPISATPAPTTNTGEELMQSSDCFTCHQIDSKLVGPSYEEIAAKYAGQTGINETLIKSIIEGSKGKFGEVPMTPHPTVSQEDAAKMVDYILTLKK